MCMFTGQIWLQVNFDLTKVDPQFPVAPSPKKQRKLRINLGKKILTLKQLFNL